MSKFLNSKANVVFYLDSIICFVYTISIISSNYNTQLSSVTLKLTLGFVILRIVYDCKIFVPDVKIFFLILLLITVQLICSLTSVYTLESLYVTTTKSIYYSALFVPIIFIRNLKQLRIILLSFIILTFILSILELGFYIKDIVIRNYPPSEFRIHYFGYPITIAEIKMVALIIILPFFFVKQNFFVPKIWLLILAIPIFISFYFTNSRGAYLGLLSGMIYIGFAKEKKLIYGLSVIVILFILFAPFSLKARILSISDSNLRSNQSRILMWETSVKMFKDYPLLGVGNLANLQNIYQGYRVITITGEGVHMHNNLIQILITTGLIGLLSWLSLMFYLFKQQISIYLQTKKVKILHTLTISSIASMIAFQISGLTDWNFGDFPYIIVFWFSISLAFISERFLKESEDLIPVQNN